MLAQGTRRLPLSAAQRGVWFAHQFDTGGRKYNCGEQIEIAGDVDPTAVRAAWTVLRAEADVLRVRSIGADDEGLWQYLDAPDLGEQGQDGPPSGDPPLLDLSADPDPRARADEWVQAELATPVDLEKGPLSHAALLRLGPGEFRFFYRIHHILVDAFSVHLLRRRLAELCTDPESGGGFGPLAELAEEEAAYRSSERFAADRDYWMERFADRPEPFLLPGTPAGEDPPLRLRLERRVTA
ncbi:MAG: condensation domain-containing protein, partial [Stackebrandtia sp.]